MELLISLAAVALILGFLVPARPRDKCSCADERSHRWSPATALFGIFMLALLGNFLPHSVAPLIGQLLVLALVLVGLRIMVSGLFR